jgi:hypothetical protein
MLHRSAAGRVTVQQKLRAIRHMGWGEASGGVGGEIVAVGQVLAGIWAVVVMLEALVEGAQRKGCVQGAICTYSVGVAKALGSVEAERQCSDRSLMDLELAALGVTASPLAAMILRWLV